MKKIISAVLALVMLFVFAACNNTQKTEENTASEIEITQQKPEKYEEPVINEEDYVKEVWDAEVPNDAETIIKAYDEYLRETFFAEYDSEKVYHRLFDSEDELYKEESVPDGIVSDDELKAAGFDFNSDKAEKYNGLYVDVWCNCYLVGNFTSEKEIHDNMAMYIAEEIFAEKLDLNFVESNGKVYLFRGNRGYGVSAVGNVVSCETLEDGSIECYIQRTSFGSGMENIDILTISDVDGNKKLVSVKSEISFG